MLSVDEKTRIATSHDAVIDRHYVEPGASSASCGATLAGRRTGSGLSGGGVRVSSILDAFEDDHFKGNEANAGQHRTIHIPSLGGTKALILDANASGTASTRFTSKAAIRGDRAPAD